MEQNQKWFWLEEIGDNKINMLEYTFEYVAIKEDTRFIDKDEIKQKYYNWLGNIDDDIDCFGDFLREYLQIDDLEICDDNIVEIYHEIKDML